MVNFNACILLGFFASDDMAMTIILIAASIVVNLGIYAIGEVIQLLDDIKQNTSGKAQEIKA